MEQKTTVDKIIENFDFDTVLALMTVLEWEYIGVPVTKKMIVETATYLLIKADTALQENYSTSTGGFKVTKITHENGTHLSLDFVFKSWSEKLY